MVIGSKLLPGNVGAGGGGPLLEESFDYSDGNLDTVSSNAWTMYQEATTGTGLLAQAFETLASGNVPADVIKVKDGAAGHFGSVQISSTRQTGALYATDLGLGDKYTIEADITLKGNNGSYVGLFWRLKQSDPSGEYQFWVSFEEGAINHDVNLYRGNNNGFNSSLDTGSFSAVDTFHAKVIIDGNSVSVEVDDVEVVSGTMDSKGATHGGVGFGVRRFNNNDDAYLDNFKVT